MAARSEQLAPGGCGDFHEAVASLGVHQDFGEEGGEFVLLFLDVSEKVFKHGFENFWVKTQTVKCTSSAKRCTRFFISPCFNSSILSIPNFSTQKLAIAEP